MTRLLVTGGGGQLASCLAELTDDPAFRHLELHVLGRSELDITDADTIRTVVGRIDPDVIVNTAAFTGVDAAESDAGRAGQVNGDAVAALARHTDRRLIHISTDYVFDGTNDSPYVESDPIAPLGVYGTTKERGEAALRSGHPDHLILRTAWVYSAYGHNFVKTMLRLGATHDHLRVVDDQVGCPTSAHDLARAVLQLATHDVTGTFHLAGPTAATWYEFAVAIFEAAALDVTVEPIPSSEYPTPAARPANSRLDSAAIAEAAGVRLPAWRDSLPRVIEQIRATSD
ncbi:MAG: dTDP-4-dehydrorhamnose reductase [Actinomycetota bacterium]